MSVEISEHDDNEAKKIRNACLVMLTRREFSTKEITDKIRLKFESSSTIHQVISTLKTEGLLCDVRFTESFVRSRINKGQGKQRIKAEIKHKGIGDELVKKVIDEQGTNWISIAEKALLKKFGTQVSSDRKEVGKRIRFLQYRGFDFDEINQVMKQL
ncbi:MAG: regulatory protein RecX [SAR92 clade bacterium]|uniref:Regulatory protein RecX n=1 Tax=SAR92 clade bacterium TaxID=2315479 RepID=A0A520LJK2_9GAMM|nr:MAG: regulatory protein RecX [SAR92 clade bacterium]